MSVHMCAYAKFCAQMFSKIEVCRCTFRFVLTFRFVFAFTLTFTFTSSQSTHSHAVAGSYVHKVTLNDAAFANMIMLRVPLNS